MTKRMMDECMKPCCGVSARLSVSDLFDRGLRRSRQVPLPVQGDERRGAGDLVARFSLSVENGKLGQVRFKASTCITLIAYCELIAETATGGSIQQSARLSAADLVAALPDVPALKRDRAPLAIAAFRDALVRAPQDLDAALPPRVLHQSAGTSSGRVARSA